MLPPLLPHQRLPSQELQGLRAAPSPASAWLRTGCREPPESKAHVRLQDVPLIFTPPTQRHGRRPPPKGKGMVNGQQQGWGLREVLTPGHRVPSTALMLGAVQASVTQWPSPRPRSVTVLSLSIRKRDLA